MEFKVRLNTQGRPPLEATAAFSAQSVLLGLTGPSGAGKTTLLRALAGLEKCAQVNVSSYRRSSPRIMMVFSEPCLFPHLSVEENLILARQYSADSGASLTTYTALCHCEHLLGRAAVSLSSGEAQRVALARALASQPDILLIDEGMGAIDSATRRAIISGLKQYATKTQLQVVLVSHDISDLALYADELALLEAGSLVCAGQVARVLGHYATETSLVPCLSLLEGKATDPDPRYPYHRFLCEGQVLYAHSRASFEEHVRLVVDARQVSLDKMDVNQSTLVNAFACQIVSMDTLSDAELRVTLRQGDTTLYAIISHLSRDRLGLTAGDAVTARFKLC
ncbi:ATP-binding cassette domain-containing protein [Alteromonas halophila]|uniref:ATP-binding cassette domain-containing protein n=1 Tax=Alteromonas halophila TaxID=516698 RepID=A0A918JQA0_9ALTE|nr:ATP-binding cassette domain-containing protein [Alteromonas halophila]GGW89643.1 hypothetical protein GCM10007391_24920 [Alteromonas halophila]